MRRGVGIGDLDLMIDMTRRPGFDIRYICSWHEHPRLHKIYMTALIGVCLSLSTTVHARRYLRMIYGFII